MASSKTGLCSACGYSPLSFEASCCPRCAAPNTRPTLVDRFVGRGMLFGLGKGVLVGAGVGWASARAGDEPGLLARVIIGALVGAIPGLIIGLFLGLVAAVLADLYGKLSGRPLEAPAGGLVVPYPVQVYYCGRCHERQEMSEGEDCVYCRQRTVIWNIGRESEDVVRRRWADMNRES